MPSRPTEQPIPALRRRVNSNTNLALVFKLDSDDDLGQLITDWLNSCRASGLSPKTIGDYEKNVNKFWWWWREHTGYAARYGAHPNCVTTRLLREYVLYLRTPNAFRWGAEVRPGKHALSPVSIASYGRDLKVFFNYLEAEGHIEATPFNKSVKFAVPQKERAKLFKTVEENDQQKILLYLLDEKNLRYFVGRRDLAIVSLLLDTGIRRGELIGLKDTDFDFSKNMCKVKGKTGERYVHFSEACREAIRTYMNARDEVKQDYPTLWVTVSNQPLGLEGFSGIVRRLKKATGVNFHAHQLRHTFATEMAEGGMGVADLSKLLGHANMATTQIYIHRDGSKLGEAYRPLSPLNRLQEVSTRLRRRPGKPRKER